MKKMHKGQAALLIIFVIGMVSLLIGISLTKTGFQGSLMGRATPESLQSFYAANSGVEDAVIKIIKNPDDPITPYQLNNIGGADVNITVGVDGVEKTIRSVGTDVVNSKKYLRRIEAKGLNNSLNYNLSEAIFAGSGGLNLDGTIVLNLDGIGDANVYSRSTIVGKSDKCSDHSHGGDTVFGNATASGSISNVCIKKDAYAPNIKNIGSGTAHILTPAEKPFPNIGVEFTKLYLVGKDPNPYPHDCIIAKTGDTSDCAGGTGILGNRIINGNLTIEGSLQISGPVWVKGKVIINNDKKNPISIKNPSDITDETYSPMIIADGTIEIRQNSVFTSYDKAFLLLASTYDDGTDINTCAKKGTHTIEVNANIDSVFFYANNGCVSIDPTASSQITGAIYAKTVSIKNSSLFYNSNLANSKFIFPGKDKFVLVSFKEY